MTNGPVDPGEPRARRRGSRGGRLEVALTLAFTAWVAWPFLDPSGFVTGFDTVTYSGPDLVTTVDALRALRLPMWSPSIFGGAPFAANAQTAVFDPIQLLAVAVGPARGLELTTAVHLFLLAVGMLVLVRHRLRLRAPAGALAAIVVVGGGTVMARSLQFEQLAVLAWVPWVLAATDAVVHAVRPGRAIAATGLATGALLLAGHPQQVYIAIPLVLAWTLARALDARPTGPAAGLAAGLRSAVRPVGRSLAMVALGGLLGIGIAAVQLAVTGAQLGSVAPTAANRLATASRSGYVLQPSLVPTALLGDPATTAPTTTADSSEAMGFVGVTAAILALVGLAAAAGVRRTRSTALALGAVGLGAVVLALGPMCSGPADQVLCARGGTAYRAAATLLPGFAQARVPGRWLALTTFAVALLAAFGMDALRRAALPRRALRNAAVLGGALVVVALAAGPEILDGPAWRAPALWAAGALLTVAVIARVATEPTGPTAPTAPTAPTDPTEPTGPTAAPHRTLLVGQADTTSEPATGPLAGRTTRASTRAAVVLVALVVLELGIVNAHSLARASSTPRPFTELAGSTATFLAGAGDRAITVVPLDPGDLAATARALQPNSNATAGVRSIDGYDGGLWVTRPWVGAMAALTTDGRFEPDLPAGWQLRTPLDADLLARFGVRYVVIDPTASAARATDPTATPTSERARLVPGWTGPVHVEGSLEVWENPRAADPGRVYHQVVVVPAGPGPDPGSDPAVTEALRRARPEQAVIVDPSVPVACPDAARVGAGPSPSAPTRGDAGAGGTGPCAPTSVRVDRPEPGRLDVVTDADADGLLVVPEQRAPGWAVTVDGDERPLVAADSLGLGVAVPRGRHTVSFRYEAPGLRLGAAISALALVTALVLLAGPTVGRAVSPVIGRRRRAR